MSKKRWEDETLKPTLEKYPERKEALLDERERLNVPDDVKIQDPNFPVLSHTLEEYILLDTVVKCGP